MTSFTKLAVLAIVSLLAACGPVLQDGPMRGSKYEIESSSVQNYPNHVHVVNYSGSWITRSDSYRDLDLFDIHNGGAVDLCLSVILWNPSDETNFGLWFPTENFRLHPNETRKHAAGFAKSRSGEDSHLKLEIESWIAAADDPRCEHKPAN